MKKNKLYTANKWNQPASMPHKFYEGSQMYGISPGNAGLGLPTWNSYYNMLAGNNNTSNISFGSTNITTSQATTLPPQLPLVSSDSDYYTNGKYWQNQDPNFQNRLTWNPIGGFGKDDSNHPILGGKPSDILGDPTKGALDINFPKDGLKNLPGPTDTNHNWFGISKENNSFSKQNIKGTMGGIAGAALSTPQGDKLLDDLDPVYRLAGGRESTIGNGLSATGKGLFKAGASTGNGWLMLAGAGAKVLGGLTNAAFGVKYNKENIADVQNNIAGMKASANKFANVTSNEGLMNAWQDFNSGYDFSRGYIGKNGWFNHKASKKANSLRAAQQNTYDIAMRSLMESTKKVDAANDDRVMRKFAALGGPLNIDNDNMGAIEYGFMSDYLNMKNKQTNSKNNILNTYLGTPSFNSFADGGGIHIDKNKEGTFTAAATKHHMGVQEFASHVLAHPENYSPAMRKKANFARNAAHWHSYGGLLNDDTLFALGGDIQSNGTDWTDGLSHVDAGGTHEENPNEGVPMGIAPDGQPNLVEEGETIWNDYVFSNRIQPDEETLKQFRVYSKGGKMTYADLSKKLEDEAKERPNDPISQVALEANMEKLANAQERQKQEEERAKAKEAFEALSPEEQQVLMQQMMQQKAATEQQPTEPSSQEAQGQEIQEPQEGGNDEQQYQEQPNEHQGEEQQAYEGNPQEQYAQEGEPMEENYSPEEAQRQQELQAMQEQPVEAAYGGSLHKFEGGGKAALSKAMKLYTAGQWNDWATKNGLKNFSWDSYKDLASLMKNKAFKNALFKSNASLADAISRNYDFGQYVYDPSKEKSITNIHNGNWRSANVGNGFQGWLDYGNEAPDPMVNEAIKNYMTANNIKDRNKAIDAIKAISRDDLQKLFSATNAYKKSSKALEDENNSLQYLNAILNDPTSPKEAKDYASKFVKNGKWIEGKDHSYAAVYGSNGKGVRNTYPGTYWHSFLPAVRGKKTTDLMWNPKTESYELMEAVPEGLKPENTYNWQDKDNDNTINYYRMPDTKVATKPNKPKKENRILDYKNDKLRYLGLLGPAIGLGLWSVGVGKPDTSGLDSALEYASTNNGGYADYKPVGNYLAYNPMDIWAEQAKMYANSRATDRAIANSSLPTSSKYTGLLANAYNNQVADSDLYRKALEYNDAKRQQTAAFNQKTDLANAEAYNRAALTNAEMDDRNAQFRANLAANIASQKMAADASWNQGLYGNIQALTKGISDLGRENAQYNMIAGMANAGVFGKLPTYDKLIALTGRKPTAVESAAKGGKLNKRKRKGLTF